jgi:hypothetical protein
MEEQNGQTPQETTVPPTADDNLQIPETSAKNSEDISDGERRRLANLRPPFKKGEVNNPKGRPRGILNFQTRLNMAIDRLAQEYVVQHNKKYRKQIDEGQMPEMSENDVDIMGDIFAKYMNAARNGDLKTAKDLLDRTYGRAVQKVEVGGIDGNPLTDAKIKAAQAEADAWERAWVETAASKADGTGSEPAPSEEEIEQSRQDDIQEDSTSMEEKLEALSE